MAYKTNLSTTFQELMKNIVWINILYSFLIILIPSWLHAQIPAENTIFTIQSSKQTITFSEDDRTLKAKIETEEVVRCNLKTGEYFRKYLYFDNTSKIEKISMNSNFVKPIITDDIPRSGIFHSDSKLAYVDHRFDIKNKTLTLETEKTFDEFKFIDLLSFQQYNYAVEYSEIVIKIPNWLTCDLEKFNFEKYNIKTKVEEEKKYKIYTFIAENLPAALELMAEPDFRHYRAHIMLLPRKMVVDDTVIPLLVDINSLYAWYNSLAKEIGNDIKSLETLVMEITKDKPTKLEKIKAIYYYIQNNIKYVAFEHGIMGFKPESCQNVLKNKFGDCKGMANLAKSMLDIIGVDARLTWLGTDGSPYNYDYASVYVDNHMICTIIYEGQYVFLDPTEKYNDLFDYASRIQGRQVLIQDGEKFIRTVVPVQDAEKHMTQNILALKIDGSRLLGNGNYTLKGNSKTYFASLVQSAGEKNKEKAIQYFISKKDKNILAKTNQNQLMPARDTAFTLEYDFVAENQIIELGAEKYINLEFERPLSTMTIEDKRTCGYYHGYKKFESSTTILDIPTKHVVKYLPTSISEINELGSFELSYEVKDNKVIYNKNIRLNVTMIPEKSFDVWKKLIKQMNEFFDDRIILEVAK